MPNLSDRGVCACKTNKPKTTKKTSPPNKKTSANLPVKSCGSLHLDTRVYFLNFCLLVSCTFARSDPISRAEWHALIVRENACAELLIYLSLLVWFSLHAARHEECVQVLCVWFFFFPFTFRNKQFYLFAVSVSILYSPWVLLLFSEM